MDPYDQRGTTYPVPSGANSMPASQPRPQQQPQQDPGFLKKLMTLLSKANLPDSGTMAGRTQRAVQDTPDEISDRSRGASPPIRVGGDTYTITPEEWDAQINGKGGPAAVPPSNGPMPQMPDNSERDLAEMGGGGGAPAGSPKGGGKKSGPMASLMKRKKGSAEADQVQIGGKGAPRDAYTDEVNALLKRVEGKGELDLSPVLSLVDTWTGSNFAKAYDKPMSEDDRQKLALQLRLNLKNHADEQDYKRSALAQRAVDEQNRREDKAAQNANQVLIANIAANSRQQVAETGANSRQTVATIRANSKPAMEPLKKPAVRGAVEQLAMVLHGNPADQYDPKNKQTKMYVPEISAAIAQKAADTGRTYEEVLKDAVAAATAPAPEEPQ